MIEKEKEIRTLMDNAESDIEADDLEEARKKLEQAIQMAKKIRNEELLKKIFELFGKIGYVFTETQSVELSPIETDRLILDIGGGGEGVIGKLNGRQVIAIDTSRKELEETQNEALKVIMDATGLKFLSNSFDVCTSFFSLMYIPNDKHMKVFREVYRVLKDDGKFLLWDVEIPRKREGCNVFIVPLKIRLPNEEIETGYGVKWHTQDIEHFKGISRKDKIQNSRRME